MAARFGRTILHMMLLLAAVGGAWVSGLMLIDHAGSWHVDAHAGSSALPFCKSNDRAEPSACVGVTDSRYGAVDFVAWDGRRHVMPTAFAGLAYFVFALAWFGLLGRVAYEQRWARYASAAGVFLGIACSVLLIALMAWSLRAWCPGCLAVHGLNAVLASCLVALLIATRHTHPAHPSDLRRNARLATATVAAGLAAVAGAWLFYDANAEVRYQWRKLSRYKEAIADLTHDRAFVLREFEAQPILDLPQLPRPGLGEPPVLVVFADPDSASCSCFNSQQPALIDQKFDEPVHVVHRFVPHTFRGAHTADPQLQEGSRRICRAMIAADLQGPSQAVDEFRSLVYRHRADGPDRDMAAMAKQAGLDATRLMEDLAGEEVTRRLEENLQLIETLAITELPAVYLSGRHVPSLCVRSGTFWRAIAEKMQSERMAACDASVSDTDYVEPMPQP